MISQFHKVIKDILTKFSLSAEDIAEDDEKRISLAKVLAQAVDIALPSALSELSAFIINKDYVEPEVDIKEVISNREVSETNILCIECGDVIEDMFKKCFKCGGKMHENCGISPINSKKTYCSVCRELGV